MKLALGEIEPHPRCFATVTAGGRPGDGPRIQGIRVCALAVHPDGDRQIGERAAFGDGLAAKGERHGRLGQLDDRFVDATVAVEQETVESPRFGGHDVHSQRLVDLDRSLCRVENAGMQTYFELR